MSDLPETYQKLAVRKLTSNFRQAVNFALADLCKPKNDEVCVKNKYVGLSADDINVTSGRFFSGKPLSDIGFEGIGDVVLIGQDVKHIHVGDKVAYFTSKYNAYAEYSCVPVASAFKVPEVKPEYLVLVVSGLTASIGLDKAGQIKDGETVLITAAAGGVGHIAVQWAKLVANCHVIGTCSTDEKTAILKHLGCDRVINYEKEDLEKILKDEYPEGVNVVWETIGGKMLQICLRNLAIKGRLIVAGGISGYERESGEAMPKIDVSNLPEMVMMKSRTIRGYNMENYSELFPSYFYRLQCNLDSGKIDALYNIGCSEMFTGLEGIINGIEHLLSGKSIGKTLVKMI